MKKILLQNKKHYSDDFSDILKYKNVQVSRHAQKLNKRQKQKYYQDISKQIKPYFNNHSEMLCLGTRNNHERDCFRENLNVKNIFSLDIADESKADYVMDFNSLPEEWKFKWDVIYSNSIDHALDATAVFYKWLNIVKEGGLIVIGFDISYENPCETDCNTFKKEKIISFFKEIHNKKIKILEHNTIACGDGTDYFHITLKKL
jgi:SAM-dependent methyltransferase